MPQAKTILSGALACLVLLACGGGGEMPAAPSPMTPVGPLPKLRASSEASPLASQCAGAQTGVLIHNAEVEPYLAVNPVNPQNLIAVWQQDRWANGGAQGQIAAVSHDGGASWRLGSAAFSRCTGGNAGNGGDYQRVSDPWVSFAPNGVVYQAALSFTGDAGAPGSSNAMLVSRSVDSGASWSAPITLIRDGADAFNDKETLTADPSDARYAYVVWDRLEGDTAGPSYFARTVDGGVSWQPARVIYNPGSRSQTIGNQIVVLGDGSLLNVFTQIDYSGNSSFAFIAAIRSRDHGDNWSAPVTIGELRSVGARDPETQKRIRDGSLLPVVAAGPGNSVNVAWQDARFGDGLRDGIVLSRSSDGGASWSAPQRINSLPSTQAFTPSIHVRADGVIGISYFDLRSNTADRSTLLTEHWLARSADGVNWSETRLSGPFNLAIAPDSGGYFIGDYHGLNSADSDFLALFVQTTGNSSNASDVFLVRPSNTSAKAAAPLPPLAETALDAAFAARVQENLAERAARPRLPRKPLRQQARKAR